MHPIRGAANGLVFQGLRSLRGSPLAKRSHCSAVQNRNRIGNWRDGNKSLTALPARGEVDSRERIGRGVNPTPSEKAPATVHYLDFWGATKLKDLQAFGENWQALKSIYKKWSDASRRSNYWVRSWMRTTRR